MMIRRMLFDVLIELSFRVSIFIASFYSTSHPRTIGSMEIEFISITISIDCERCEKMSSTKFEWIF